MRLVHRASNSHLVCTSCVEEAGVGVYPQSGRDVREIDEQLPEGPEPRV
jgi:hypothetical protein